MKRLMALVMLLCMAASCAWAEEAAQPPATLTAVGTARVAEEEHYTLLTMGLSAGEETVALAHAELEEMRTVLLEVLAQLDIPQEALRYTYYDVESVYDYHYSKLTENRLLIGFVAEIAVEIRLEDSKRAGELVDAVHTAGLDCTSELSFESEPLLGAREAAIAAAAEDAQNRAQLLAQAFGLSLGELLSVQESSVDGMVQVEAVYAVE